MVRERREEEASAKEIAHGCRISYTQRMERAVKKLLRREII